MGQMVFFNPTVAFARWLKQYAGDRLIVEAGCGACTLLDMLTDMRAKAIGVDPIPPLDGEIRSNFLPLYIEDVSFVTRPNILFVTCRPSHGGWVGYLANQLQKTNNELLYVGLTDNIMDDLYEIEYQDVTAAAPPTDTHECVLSINKQQNELSATPQSDDSRSGPRCHQGPGTAE